MGSTAQKLQKALDNKQLIVDSVNAKAGTSYDINSKPSDIANTITDIETGSNGLPIEVNELPTLGTAVPTSGMIEKVYVNTSLSTQEVIDILEKLTFVPYQNDTYIWACLADSTMANGLAVTRFQEGNSFIYHIAVSLNGETIPLFTYTNGSDDGWSSDFNGVVEFNIENQLELIAPMLNFTPENEKAKNLFSITPIDVVVDGAIYKTPSSSKSSVKGTPIPTKGYLDKIYVNTALSAKEVYDKIKNTEPFLSGIKNNTESYFLGVYYLYDFKRENDKFRSGLDVIFATAYDGEGLRISVSNGDGNPQTIFEFGFVEEQTFNGWNPDFNGVIDVNYEWDVANVDIMAELTATNNEDWSFLFSTTPFGKEYHLYEKEKFTQLIPEDELQGEPLVVDKLPYHPKEVVTDTYVENIYFNTKLSNSEIDKMLETLTYKYDANNVGGYMVYWADTERYAWDSLIIYDLRKISSVEPFVIATLGNGTIYSSDTGFAEGFNGVVEVNSNISSTIEGQEGIAGLENSKLKNLISITPFDGGSDINPNGIYFLKKDAEVWSSEYGELVNIGELAKEQGTTFMIYFADKQPALEDMKPSFVSESLMEVYIYWVESENEGYLSMDGQVVKYSETVGIDLPVSGVVTSLDEIIGDGMYILKPDTNKYYKYENGWVELIRQENEFFKVSELPNDIAPIPNGGNIYELYFNKELSFEEIYNILSSLTYMDLSSFGLPYPAYIVFASMLTETAGLVLKVDAGGVDVYHLFIIPDFFNVLQSGGLDDLTYRYVAVYKDESGINGTWNEEIPDTKYVGDSYNLKDEVLSTFEGLELGSENEKLKDLFYIRTKGESFNGAIYKVGKEPKVVPNSGYVENIYFNTNLNSDEVLNIINKLNYIDVSSLGFEGYEAVFVYSDASMNYALGAVRNGEDYYISLITNQSEVTDFWSYGFGWHSALVNPLPINKETALSDLAPMVGQEIQNEALKNLFSTTPFKKDYYLCKNGKFDEMVIPEGTLEITENGEVDIRVYEKVNVNVIGSGSGEDMLQKRVNENGTRGLFAFSNYDNLDYFINKLNLPILTDISYMYYNCSNLVSLPQLDTSNVIDMNYAFNTCSSLTSISQLNTNSCQNMENTFSNCSKLKSISLTNTQNVTSIRYAFYNCEELETISSLNTSNVNNITYSFMGCKKLKLIDISHYNISSTTNCSYTFRECNSLKALVIRSFGSGTVLNANAFQACYHILGIKDITYNPNSAKDGYIYVPRSMVNTLTSGTNWSTYASQYRALEDYTLDGTTSGELDLVKMGITEE